MSLMEIDNPASPIMAITPVPPSEYSEPHPDDEQPSNRRRKKSIVWEHFTIENVGPGCMRAVCNQCKKSFAYITGLKLAGTSHLKRHIALGICPVSRQKGEVTPHTPNMSSGPPKKRPRVSPGYVNLPFDQNRCTLELAKMIIRHDYPLHIVEHPAFVEFVKTLQPQYSMVSFNTIEGECVGIYLREKQYLLDLISGNPARVNLTLDLATSNHGIGYAFITGHFIDRDWNLQRLLLNVIVVPFPDSDYAFNRAIVSCLTDWHLESKLFTLTLDRSFSSDTMTGNLRGMLSVRNPLVLNGQLLQGSCFARVLSRLAQDVIWSMGDIVKRIRQSVKYVKTSEAYDEKFAELRQQLQVPSTRELVLDNPTKWNTTYDMLVAACELKEVFSCMDPSDPVYNINLNPSIDDWKRVEVLCTYLKLFFDAANFLTSAAHPLANSFYHEVSKIQLELNHAALSQDPIVSNLTRPLKEKFDQYWKEVFLVLALAVVMDPRFKMKLIEFSFSRIFGEEAGTWVKTVDDGIHELFYDYIAPHYFLPAAPSVEGDMVISHFEAPEDVEMAPQDMPSQVVAQEVAHQQEGVTFQERQTREIPPPEMNHQDVSSTEVDNQELSIYDVTTQQMHTQEIPEELPQEIRADELKPEEMHNQEVLQQEMQADTVPSRDSQVETVVPENIQDRAVTPQLIEPDTMPSAGGIQAEAAASLETKAGSVPSQDMQAETVVPQHIQDEVGISQDVQSLGVTSEEMQTEAVPPQEVISEVDQIESGEVPLLEVQTEAKSVPPVEVQKKSVEVPLPEVQTEAEAVAPLEVQTKSDAIPSEELQAEGEVLPKEKVESEVEAVAPQEVQAEPISTEALPLQEMQSEVVQSQDAQAEAVPTGEVQAEAVPLQDEQVEAVVPQDVQKDEAMAQEEKQNEEVPAEKVHAWEETAKDLNNHNERPKEMNSQTIPPAEVDVQEVPPPQDEVQPQEMETKEVPSQEEVQPHAMETEEVATQEMDIQEVKQHEGHIEDGTKEPPPLAENSTQAESPQEKQNQEALPEDVHAEGLLSEDAQAPDVVSHDMQTQEKQPEDLRSNGVDVIEKQPEDLHNKDGSLQRMESQGLPQMTVNKELPQEVQHQEMPTQEAQSQEMQPQMLSQDTHSQGLHSQDMPMISIADGLSDFDVYISEITSGNKKSELDQYLEESLLPRVQEFDVLDWWKLNKLKYPTLSKLAADILSIPISTVSPDSIFDIENKTIHQYQSSLRSVTLEALICAKDWLQHGPSTPKFANALVKME